MPAYAIATPQGETSGQKRLLFPFAVLLSSPRAIYTRNNKTNKLYA